MCVLQMTNITQPNFESPWNTDLIYYLVEGQSGNLTAASRTVYLAKLFTQQEMSQMINYVVLIQAESK